MKKHKCCLILLAFFSNISFASILPIQTELSEKFEYAIKKIDYKILFDLAFEDSSFFWTRLKPNALEELKKNVEIQNKDLEGLHPDQLSILDATQRQRLKELLIQKSKDYKKFQYLVNKSGAHFLAACCSASLTVNSCINKNKTLAIISGGLSYLFFKQMSIYDALFRAADPISNKLTAIAEKICNDYTLFKSPLSNHKNDVHFHNFKRGFNKL